MVRDRMHGHLRSEQIPQPSRPQGGPRHKSCCPSIKNSWPLPFPYTFIQHPVHTRIIWENKLDILPLTRTLMEPFMVREIPVTKIAKVQEHPRMVEGER